MTESAEGWLGRGSDGHILPLSNLTAMQVMIIQQNLVDMGNF